METNVAAKKQTRTALLETGLDIMLGKGFSNTGIQEILMTLNVPKGSFYHYFDSKEAYAVEIIRHFDQAHSAFLMRILGDLDLTPLQRLRAYCDHGKTKLAAQQCKRGCLIGNLGLEMSDQSEVLRQELSSVGRKWRDMFADCIAEGQRTGEITCKYSANEAAEFFVAGWGGAVLRAKTQKDTESLEIFIDLIFDILKA